jgi:hypothetical protein
MRPATGKAFDALERGSEQRTRHRMAVPAALALVLGLLAGCTGSSTASASASASMSTPASMTVPPSPPSSSMPTASPSVPVAKPVTPRKVTTGAGIPSAQPLDDASLNAAGSGWVLTLFDTGSYDASHNPTLGDRILYLIAPDGTRYQAGTFAPDKRADLVGWNVAQEKVLMRINEFSLAVFDLRTDVLGPAFLPCGTHALDIRVQPRTDGAWQVRGACVGAQVDGVYADDGTQVADPNFQASPFGTWATDVGGRTVVYSYDSKKWTATAAPGDAPVPLQLPPAASSCKPIGNGRGTTVAASCSGPDGISVWELDATGGPAVQVATPAQIADYANALAGSNGGTVFTDIAQNCVVGDSEVLVVRATIRSAGLAGGANLDPVWLHAPAQSAAYCWGSHGTVGLFSAYGSLWTHDIASGATVPMIAVDALTTLTPQIGVAETRSLIAP